MQHTGGTRSPASRLPSITFLAPFAYPVLTGDRSHTFVGGAEVQMVTIATELAARGYPVSMICHDHGQAEGTVVRGVRLVNMHAPHAGIPGLRFIHPRFTSVWAAMRRADADVYYQRASGVLTAYVAAFARLHGRRSVFAGAHDMDFLPELPLIQYGRDRALYRWGIRRVDQVVAQSERQRQLCMATFGRASTLIHSCYAHRPAPARHDGLVLWVATAKRHKRPHLLLDLAERLPQLRFRLVGGPGSGAEERAYFEQLRQRAATLANVEMTGFVPHADVEQHFDAASVFVNTSVGEGFPNTFMQAWSRGIPTVSFFDPMASQDGAPVGVVVSDVDAMAREVAKLKSHPDRWSETGDRARRYVAARHSADAVIGAYERLIGELARSPGGRPGSVERINDA
jgi:glycosyltransferase involved in cell wall biosynthesis